MSQMKDSDAGGMQRRSEDEGQSKTIFESVLFTSTSHTKLLEKRCKATDASVTFRDSGERCVQPIQKCFPGVIYGVWQSGELSRKYRSAYCRMWSTALSRSTSVLASTSSSEE